MSTAIVLPSLANWTKSHITAIFQATTTANFNSAFDAFVSQDANITLNGRHISREQYKQQLQAEKFAESGATVRFNGTIEVPSDQDRPAIAGNVGVFYEATIAEKLRVEGGPASSVVTTSLNVVITQEPGILHEPRIPVHGFFDGRRVSVLNAVTHQVPAGVIQPSPDA